MRRINKKTVLLISAVLLCVTTVYAGGNGRVSESVTIFAAAGITNAMEEMSRLYELETGCKVVCNFDSSSRLARQIQAGAEADIFISANNKWVDVLQDNELIDSACREKLVSTDLVLITSIDSDLVEGTRFDLEFARNFKGTLAIGDYSHVPAGVYAKQAMESLGAFMVLKDKLALCSNVADALRFVEIGQCRAGIVYKSSAVSSKKVCIVSTIAKETYNPVVFTSAVVNRDNQAALDFLAFIGTAKNRTLFADHGFKPVETVSPTAIPVEEALISSDEWSVLKLSIKVAGFCIILIMIPGIMIGWFLARTKFRGKMLIEAFVHLPLIMPPVVTGYLALIILGKKGFIGSLLYDHFGISLPFTWYAAVITSAIMGMPLLIRSVKLAIQLIDKKIENAASTLGAGPIKVFLTVTLPLALPGILSGLILAFARSLGEFGATATFAGNIPGKTRTLSLAIHSLTQIPSREDSVMRLVAISITISVLAMLFSEIISRKMLSKTGTICHD